MLVGEPMARKACAATFVIGVMFCASGCDGGLLPESRSPGAPAGAGQDPTAPFHDADLGGTPPDVGGVDIAPVLPPATPVDTSQPALDAVDLNPGWIGGSCETSADCTSSAFTAPAICETNGFAGGMCTQACTTSASGTYVCPDTNYSSGTLNAMSRCIDANGAPRCAAECDFNLSTTGCRTGYACVLRQRFNDPSRILPICLPSDLQRWPGEQEAPFDIGSPCDVPQDCAHLSCLGYAAGYCSKSMCELAGCPTGSACFRINTSNVTQCMKQCGGGNNCRTDDGYVCDSEYSTCWPADGGRWDSTVGAADCASAWGESGSALSPCDSTPDDYIVIHKSARNLALCKMGALVDNFSVGLGPEPAGDKQVEGDGKTPEGVFYVASTIPVSSYHKAFLVSYPDRSDAARGYAAGIISADEKKSIENAQVACSEPPQYTTLGGMVEVHGGGGNVDWTLGCVAADNGAIDEIWSVLGRGDTIVVLP